MEDEKYTPTLHTRLEPGDVLVMLTDGFMERANKENQLFGIDRLSQTISQHRSRSAREIMEALDAAATSFAAGSAQSDDMTAVVVKRLPVA
jgi:serine phosphatase RsbU (regulator of sigma subunit)